MKKISDKKLEIKYENGEYIFGILPDKAMVDAMKTFLYDKELQNKDRHITENPYFHLFRNIPKKVWKRIEQGKSIPVKRNQIFCINGEFYIQDLKVETIE